MEKCECEKFVPHEMDHRYEICVCGSEIRPVKKGEDMTLKEYSYNKDGESRKFRSRATIRPVEKPIVKEYNPIYTEAPEVFIKSIPHKDGMLFAVVDKFGDHITTLFTLDRDGLRMAPNVDKGCGIQTALQGSVRVIWDKRSEGDNDE